MSSYTLNIKVEGGVISADRNMLTADSVDYVIAAFTFDESWNSLYKTAIFRVGELVYHTPLENNSCKIPFEALKEPMMYISVFGVLDTTRATTTELAIQVQNSGYTSCEPKAPTPDPYNYFLEEVTKLKYEAMAYSESCGDALNGVNADKIAVSDMLEEVKTESKNTENNSKSAKQSAKESLDILNLIEEYREAIDSLSTEVESNADKAADSAANAENAVMLAIENHNYKDNDLAHPNILEVAQTAKSIALGKANSLCFETEKQLKDWIAGTFTRTDGKTTSDLKVGDNLYIVELNVPDYWWDGTNIQPLGAEKPDLSDYYKKDYIDSRLSDASFDLISRSDYNALYTAGALDAGRVYFVFEEA